MISKERVLIAVEHKEPDKVSKLSIFTPEFANKLRKHFDIDDNLFNPHDGVERELELRFGNVILLTG